MRAVMFGCRGARGRGQEGVMRVERATATSAGPLNSTEKLLDHFPARCSDSGRTALMTRQETPAQFRVFSVFRVGVPGDFVGWVSAAHPPQPPATGRLRCADSPYQELNF